MSLSYQFLCSLGRQLEDRPRSAASNLEVLTRLLKIRDRMGNLIDYRPNRAQSELARDPSLRKIILKARQLGITTAVAARFFIRTITRPGTLTVQVAHDQESAEEIFKIVRRFQENLPEPLRAAGTGFMRTSRFNVRQLVFPALDSEYRVATAADPNAGRGLTIQNLHCSEVARWPRNAAETLASLRAAVPPDGEIVLESTPNGSTGCFYREWQRAAETGFSRHFFPWWYEPAYANEKSDPHPLSDEEIKLVQRHALTLAQIACRRDLQAQFGALTPQEFCEDAESCFLASGECVFDLAVIEERVKFCAQQYCETRDNGALHIWYPPSPSRRYIIGADPAGGGSEGDYSAAQVIDSSTGLQCAELRGHFPPREFAVRLAALARDYNNALLVIERNNHGHAVLAHLQCKSINHDFVIPNRFSGEESAVENSKSAIAGVVIPSGGCREESAVESQNSKPETGWVEQGSVGHGFSRGCERSEHPEVNLYERNGQLGFLTTAANRPQIIANLAATLAAEPRLFNSPVLLEECRTFIRQANGTAAAAQGAFDDLVMSMAIALHARSETSS